MIFDIASALQHSIDYIPFDFFLEIVNSSNKDFIFIKNSELQYVYLNESYRKICGFYDLADIIGHKDETVFKNKLDLNESRLLEEIALNSNKKSAITKILYPNNGAKPINLKGVLYPLKIANAKDNWLLAILGYVQNPPRINFNNLFHISAKEIAALLQQRSYFINYNGFNINITRREVQCLLETLKGKPAGEIAKTLNVKQISVESYMNNLKSKFNVFTKSELIESVIKNKILEQLEQIF